MSRYHHWSSRRLLRRLAGYAAYIRCGCQRTALEAKCNNDEACARADFARVMRQLIARAGGTP